MSKYYKTMLSNRNIKTYNVGKFSMFIILCDRFVINKNILINPAYRLATVLTI